MAVVGALVEHGLAERADVFRPQAGAGDEEPAVVGAGHGGPAEIAEPLAGPPADDAVLGSKRVRGRRLRGGNAHSQAAERHKGDDAKGMCGSTA